MSDPLVTIPLADLRAVLPFMARDDVRYYLNGILVEPYNGGCLLVATNGHLAAIIESKAARCDQKRILALSTDEFRAAIAGRIAPHRMDEDDEDDLPDTFNGDNFEGTLEIADAEARAVMRNSLGNEAFILPGKPFLEGQYPDWRKIVPPIESLKPGIPSALAGRYLAMLNHPVLINRVQQQQVIFWGDDRGANKAVLVRFAGLPALVVLIMPMRNENPAVAEWPDWMLAQGTESTEKSEVA
jgi:hypothetical protein